MGEHALLYAISSYKRFIGSSASAKWEKPALAAIILKMCTF